MLFACSVYATCLFRETHLGPRKRTIESMSFCAMCPRLSRGNSILGLQSARICFFLVPRSWQILNPSNIGVSKVPENAWFIVENPIKIRMIWEEPPYFWKLPMSNYAPRTLTKTFLVVALGILGSANLPAFVRFMEHASRECSVTSAMWNTR